MNGIQRIKQTFNDSKVLIAYLTAGDGGIQRTLEAALALIQGGVNILEIGVPFSDPIADGPIIQRASARALDSETTLQEVLLLVKQIRKKSEIPIVLFSYFNPLLATEYSSFLHAAKCAGVDGLLVIDCPIEETFTLHQQCLEQQIALIYIISSSTSPSRIRKINQFANGFLYYACRNGTTGLQDTFPTHFSKKMQLIKSIVNLPVVAGFGISNPDMVSKVFQHADGAVIGSLFVKAMEDGLKPFELTSLAESLRVPPYHSHTQ